MGITLDESILDVGCGTRELASYAADLVGENAHVIGLTL
jgi:cyclopropane fatty-acyl-phospholipid synthase-like methyltransferase